MKTQAPRRAKRTSGLRVAIVGAGKVGQVLGRILYENGVPITCVVSRTAKSAAAGGRFLGCKNVSTDLAAIPSATNLVFISTPHSAVHDVARSLALEQKLRFRGLSVCHASGMFTAEALLPLKKRGATVFSFHPLQTFPRDFPCRDILPSARGIFFGVDGSPRALRRARQLAKLLEGYVFPVPPDKRVLYHAACVVASNHVTVLLWLLQGLCRSLGPYGSRSLAPFRPIIGTTIQNVLRASPARALSGPVARGGIDTVARHLEAVREFSPAFLQFFVHMTRETVRLAQEKGGLPDGLDVSFEELLSSHTSGNVSTGGHS